MHETELYSDTWNVDTIEVARRLNGPILIVGVSGFIGAKLFFTLRKYRDDVFACSRNPHASWRLSNLDSPNLLDCDITDFAGVQSMVNRLRPMTVFNLAAYGAYSRQTDIEKIHRTNYFGTLNLLRALCDIGCRAFVQAGSSSEYGLNCAFPDEMSELSPNSDYAVSKVGAGYLIKYYGQVLRFPCVNLRLYSIYGPWEEKDRLIPTLISHGLRGEYPQFAERNISRDFVYVDDCNAAVIRAAQTVCQTHPGCSINICSGVKTTLESMARIAGLAFGITNEPIFGTMQNRKWDLSNWYGNPAQAEKLLGWKSHITLEHGLALNIDWEKVASQNLAHAFVPKKRKKISAIIACYRDHKAIPHMYERLTRVFQDSGYNYEIIFVNDRSPTNDEEIIQGLCSIDPHVVGISHTRNFGSQSAFMSGMEISSGDSVILLDGDGQDPPEVIPQMIEKWEQGFDIVYGQRVKRKAPLYMQLFYKLFYRAFRRLSDIAMPVDAGDFSLIDRKAVKKLLQFTEKDVFLRGLRAWVGYKQTGVPYVRPERLFGVSTNSFAKNVWWAKKGIFSFSMKPLQYIQTIGVFFFAATVLLAGYYLVNYFMDPPQNAQGITTIVLLVLGLGSIQILSMSVLGDYIGKITEEVKNRPRFIRERVMYNGQIYEDDDEIIQISKKLQTDQNWS